MSIAFARRSSSCHEDLQSSRRRISPAESDGCDHNHRIAVRKSEPIRKPFLRRCNEQQQQRQLLEPPAEAQLRSNAAAIGCRRRRRRRRRSLWKFRYFASADGRTYRLHCSGTHSRDPHGGTAHQESLKNK